MSKEKLTQKPIPKVSEAAVKPKPNNKSFIWASLITITILGLIIYSNSFDCGFQFDDKHNILTNEAIKSIGNFKEMWALNHSRFLAFYSLALNYHFGQFDVWGYHFVNVTIHLTNAVLVFWITWLLFLSPELKDKSFARYASWIALLTALLFVSHPLATGAVTYIIQRMASMVAMFYFLSIALYMKGRLSETTTKYAYFAASALAAVCAMLTKENSYTLPFAIILIELFFFNTKKIAINFKDIRILAPLLGIVGFIIFVVFNFSFVVLKPLPPSTFNTTTITSSNYFFTQLSVIVKYIQLLFLPINQNVDYDFPIANSLFELHTILNGLILLVLLALAIYLYNKNKLISFGIFWFFITISIESSFIPISDVIFEHRTYIPSFGFFIIITTVAFIYLGEKYKSMVILGFVLVVGTFAMLAHERNKVWKDEFSLWSDVISKSPHKARGYLNRGYVYGNMQQWNNAIQDFNKVNEINPHYHAAAYYNLGIGYWTIGQKDKSMENYSMAIKVDSNYADAYYGRGVCYYYLNELDKSLADYSKAISITPRPELYYNRGMLYANKQQWNDAIKDYSMAIEMTPNNANLYSSRGTVYGNINEWDKAAKDFAMVLRLDPQNKSASSNLQYANSKLKPEGAK